MYTLTVKFKEHVNRPDLVIGPFETWQEARDYDDATTYVKDKQDIKLTAINYMIDPAKYPKEDETL